MVSLMAMKHRKLLPAPTSTNQTDDCTDPYYCFPYPDYSFPPPPPPISTNDHVNHGHHISAYVIIIIVSLIASFFLLVSYYVIVVKSCGGWISWRNNRTPQPQSDDTDEEFLDENRVDHPIWFITTVGLQHSIINSITVCKYKKGEGLIEGTGCSVCLSEFQEDETIRLLPKCNHAFHIPCIDTWLRSHTNCPLCRARIVSDTGTAPLASVEQNLDNMSLIVDTQMENSDINGNLGGNQDRRHSEICENRTEAEEESEIVQVNDGRMLKESVNINGDGVIQVQKDDIQPVRRSVSMDASLAETISLGLTNHCLHESGGSSVDHIVEDAEKLHSGIVAKQDNGYSSMFRQMGSSSVVQYLHKSPVPMKRSFSCSGRFFSSRRHNHSLNGFLPL